MKMIFNSGTSSILLNRIQWKIFHSKRGVRQGDLSPLLFGIAAGLWQSILNEAKDQVLLCPPLSLGAGTDFPIIQYADEILLIMHASMPKTSNSPKRSTKHLC
jgi:hypothetical protein